MHLPSLPYTMTSILGLLVHCWVPVRVIENHCISSRKVNPQASATRAWNEAKYFFIKVKTVHHFLACLDLCAAIKSYITMAMNVQELLKNVEHSRHLSEK